MTHAGLNIMNVIWQGARVPSPFGGKRATACPLTSRDALVGANHNVTESATRLVRPSSARGASRGRCGQGTLATNGLEQAEALLNLDQVKRPDGAARELRRGDDVDSFVQSLAEIDCSSDKSDRLMLKLGRAAVQPKMFSWWRSRTILRLCRRGPQ
jgi:hypothetical protein